MPDFLPKNDAELIAFSQNFVAYATPNLANLGLVAADLTPISTALTAYSNGYTANVAAQAAAKAAQQSKDDNRAAFVTVFRALIARLQVSPAVSDTERQALGIPVRDKTKTPTTAPTSRPVVSVDTSQRLRHTVAFLSEGTPPKKAKPKGVIGCEIWVKIGAAPPVDASETQFLALDSATPYVAQFTGADAGKTAHYLTRWVSTRGEKGPWSETVSATIPG